MPLLKIIYKEEWIEQDLFFAEYLNTLNEKEKSKEKLKTRYNTFLVFQSGNVILSSPHKECMINNYNQFTKIISDCRSKIEEKFY